MSEEDLECKPSVLRRRKITTTSSWATIDEDFNNPIPERPANRRRLSLIEEPEKSSALRRQSFGADSQYPFEFKRAADKTITKTLNYKVLVVGEVSGGKSSIIKRYVHNFYSEANTGPTVGIDFKLKLIPYEEDTEIRLQFWDVGGQSAPMTRAYYGGAHGAIVVYDHSNTKSFQEAFDRWKCELDTKCTLPGPPPNRPLPTILAANKSDLQASPDIPDDLEVSRMVQEGGFVPKWFRCSAKTGEGVDDLMNLLIKYIIALDTWSGTETRELQVKLNASSRSSDADRSPMSSKSISKDGDKRRVCQC